MLDENDTDNSTTPSTDPVTEPPADAGSASASEGAGDTSADTTPDATPTATDSAEPAEEPAPAKKAARKRTTRKTTAKKVAATKVAAADSDQPALPVEAPADDRSADVSEAILMDAAGDASAGAPAEAAPAADPGPAGEAADAVAEEGPATPRKRTTRKTTAKKVAAKKAPAKRATKKAAAVPAAAEDVALGRDVPAAAEDVAPDPAVTDPAGADVAAAVPAAGEPDLLSALVGSGDLVDSGDASADPLAEPGTLAPDVVDELAAVDLERPSTPAGASSAPSLLFKAPDPVLSRTRRRVGSAPAPVAEDDEVEEAAETDVAGLQQVPDELTTSGEPADGDVATPTAHDTDASETDESDEAGADDPEDSDDSGDGQGGRRRRRRGGRRRRRSGGGDDAETESTGDQPAAQSDDQPAGDAEDDTAGGGRGSGPRGPRQKQSGQKASDKGGGDKGGRDTSGPDDEPEADEQSEGTGSRRRRRRRRTGEESDGEQEDSQNTVTRVRKPRNAEDEITALHGSTRLEAKKQRRREGREAGRRRAPIVSEAEFLARREAVDRVMVIRQRADLTQIAVLEDQVLVEHYVARESQTSLIGNVYLGRVQNVLPSMEAAFIDIGKGRNAVLYAGEVNWDSLGAGNGPRKIESVLKSGQPILVQVSKDPIGHKGARLTSQISLPGRFLVYVPDGTTSGISRKLPDTERTRLKTLLKEIVPDGAGVIVRTAAEGASEEELTLDVERLTARWTDIASKIEKGREKGGGPQLLYGEPDLTLKVVRDLFTEDFAKLVVSGDDAWDMVDTYVKHVAPDLEERLERYSDSAQDVFAAYRIDEQIAKGLDRKVWLPSGGSLIIDRTEAMTVVDVNTGKFTGSGGNLEETVTKNNLEAAEEMIRQLRLRDIGGIIVVDFIDMVLESNRDLVLRRLVECLGRDRTRHQVAEVTSLGLVQMTRKRIGTGLLEAFSENCEVCQGRGLIVHHEPVESQRGQDEEPRRGRRGRNRGSDGPDNGSSGGISRATTSVATRPSPSPKDIAAIAKHDHRPVDEPVATPAVERKPVPVEQLPADEPTQDGADQVVGPDVSLVDEPVAPVAPEPEAPPVPKGPVMVTSTRRRVARRPAGSATPVSRPEAAGEPTPAAAAGTQPGAANGEVHRQTAPVAAPAAATDPARVPSAAPVLVTSTRRQVVRRPAGPPAGVAPGAPETTGTSDVQLDDGAHRAGDGEVDGHPESVHVPVKKKGSRKR